MTAHITIQLECDFCGAKYPKEPRYLSGRDTHYTASGTRSKAESVGWATVRNDYDGKRDVDQCAECRIKSIRELQQESQ